MAETTIIVDKGSTASLNQCAVSANMAEQKAIEAIAAQTAAELAETNVNQVIGNAVQLATSVATTQAGIATNKAAEATTQLGIAITQAANAASSANAANLSAQASHDIAFTTVALMNADLAHAANVTALVTNDPTATNNAIYIKLGASGAGSWQKSAYVPPIVTGGVVESSVDAALHRRYSSILDPSITSTDANFLQISKILNLKISVPARSALQRVTITKAGRIDPGTAYSYSTNSVEFRISAFNGTTGMEIAYAIQPATVGDNVRYTLQPLNNSGVSGTFDIPVATFEYFKTNTYSDATSAAFMNIVKGIVYPTDSAIELANNPFDSAIISTNSIFRLLQRITNFDLTIPDATTFTKLVVTKAGLRDVALPYASNNRPEIHFSIVSSGVLTLVAKATYNFTATNALERYAIAEQNNSGVSGTLDIPNSVYNALKIPGYVETVAANVFMEISISSVKRKMFIADGSVTPDKTSFFSFVHGKNYINPANISFAKRITTGTKTVISTEDIFCSTGLIEVVPGNWYTVSGTAFDSLAQGVYFDSASTFALGEIGISLATFSSPVTGSGRCFQVPQDSNIKYVVLNLPALSGAVNGTYQMEDGELASTIEAYVDGMKIKEQYLTNIQSASTTLDNASWFTFLEGVSYGDITSKISNFRKHWITKDKDLVMAGTGTSLTGRSSEHTTTRGDASSRPPLMHSNNFASKIWDKIAWDGQQYRRFDFAGMFTETGTFVTASNIADWDDGAYRYGLTRYATGPASTAFTIPVSAWQFNYIYRSDINGCQNCTVAIAEGNGKVEVYNGEAWVEANGYTFSMRQAITALSDISVPNPNVAGNTTMVNYATYQVGGNTTYQKRLKMRCKSSTIDSRATTKAVTISAAADRLLYWGVEWSPREFMLTYINAARGSHDMTTGSNSCLLKYQDNEIWSFKPDLIFSENPIYNSGGSGIASVSSYITDYWGNITNNFFFNANNPISLATRANANNVNGLEWIIFNTSIGSIDNGVDSNGNLAYGLNASGRIMSALESQMLTHEWIKENKTDVISINSVLYWVRAATKMFDTLKLGTAASGISGNTLSSDGCHWNDTGCTVMAKVIAPIFDFIV